METVQRMNQGRSHLLLGDLADNPDWFIFKIQAEDMLLKYKPGEAPGILAQLFQDNVIEMSSWYSWNYTVEKIR